LHTPPVKPPEWGLDEAAVVAVVESRFRKGG
jgi:hypothetical protein